MPLTNTLIRNARAKQEPYKLLDGGGLHVLVQPNGAKIWRRRLRVNGKETTYTIGRYPAVSLADARRQADAAYALAREGRNPAKHRRVRRATTAASQGKTFRVVGAEWIRARSREWTPQTTRQRERLLNRYVHPKLGDLPVEEIDSALVHDLLETVHKVAPAQTSFVRQAVSGVMQLAIIKRLATIDPTYVLRTAHRPPPTRHSRALDKRELKELLSEVSSSNMQITTRLAVMLAFWTLCRSKEVIGAQWDEFDLKEGTWTVPAERMKKREAHLVPLPIQAMTELRGLRAANPHRKFMFPNARDPRRAASHTFLNKAVTRLGIKGFSAHGIRATGSTMLHGMGYASEIVERQLDHRERSKTKRAYNQQDYSDHRREMMQAWADFLDALSSGADVVPIRRKA